MWILNHVQSNTIKVVVEILLQLMHIKICVTFVRLGGYMHLCINISGVAQMAVALLRWRNIVIPDWTN